MRRNFTALVVALLLTPMLPVSAEEIYPIVFPVDGPNHYSDTYGAPRGGGRTHEGTDIMAAKMTPVVAAASGTVGWVSSQCCAMELVHDDGYRSRYIHLNNDTPGTDDGLGWGFAPGIQSGVHVEAGQLIGYVGDSGNAEATASHLHFELRYPNGDAFNSYHSLLVATPPDHSSVTWHVGAIDGTSLALDSVSVTTHVPTNDGHAAWGDFDGDGHAELAIGTASGWSIVTVDGDESTWSAEGADNLQAVHVADFDGDGYDDVATFRSTNEWIGYRSTGTAFVAESWGWFGGVGWADQMIGDFDGDGVDELLSFHPGTRNWWRSVLDDGQWRHSVFTRYGTPFGWQSHIVADVDGDGRDELVSFHPSNGTWWKTDIGGSPRLVYDVSTNSGWQHLSAADVDADGFDDLIMFHPSNGTWWVVDAESQSVYLWATFNTRSGWADATRAHVDGDEYEDLMIRHVPSGRLWVVRGGAQGSLTYLGEFVAGEVEGTWSFSHPATGLGVAALTRD